MQKIYYTLLVIMLFTAGCSKSPEAYNNSIKPNDNKITPNRVPTLLSKGVTINIGGVEKPSTEIINIGIGGEDLVGGAAFDAKVKFNSSQPIIYSIGAGGIAYNTTLTEAESILAAPRSPPDNQGQTLYDEGLFITWRLDEPRSPEFILVLSSYLGKIQMPTPLEPIPMNFDFSKQYAPNLKTSAEKLARDYYNIFENANIDCVAVGKCQVVWGPAEQKNFVVSLPGLTMLISKDRMIMFRVLIQPLVPQGILANNLDLVTGQFVDQDGNAVVSMNDTFADIETRWKASVDANNKFLPLTTVNVNSFGRRYTGAYLAFDKTKFDRTDIEPLPTDKVKTIQVWGEWTNIFTLNGQPVILSEFADRVELELGAREVTPAGLNLPGNAALKAGKQIPLMLTIQVKPALIFSLAEKLKDLLESEMKKAHPTWEVTAYFAGEYQKKRVKDYSIFVTAYDKASNQGLFVQYSLSEESGNISSVVVTQLGGDASPFDQLILPEFQSPVKKASGKSTYTQLSGFKLGDEIKVTDWDLGRGEATVQLVGTNLKERSSYTERDSEFFAYSDEKAIPIAMSSVGVGSLNTSLGLKLINETETERTYKVIVIRSAVMADKVKVEGLCAGALSPEFGMKGTDFSGLVANASTSGCVNYLEEDEGGNKFLTNAFFPNEGLRLSFSENELTMATVYAPLSEVQ